MKVFFLLLFVTIYSMAQTNIEGFIFDKTTNTPLPYATIELINSDLYTITNENGKFEIKATKNDATLRIRYLGFETINIPASYFETNSKLFLKPNISDLNEIVIAADKDYAYNLLNSLIKKYREDKNITQSKAFLSLTSFARNTPIEQIEGFYNSSQNFAEGIIDLNIKSGRFGQNKSFPFYNLDNNILLLDFSLFKKTGQILPIYPGNLSVNTIKSKYTVIIDECSSCLNDEAILSFIPKKYNGKMFSGKIYFDSDKLIIKKIDLQINNPEIKQLASIIENDIVTPTEILFKISFNPLNDKIQYLDFVLKMYYNSESVKEIIKSHSFLYFYDYDKSFTLPYFTNTVNFNNDYDKIIALKASEDFWETNYQFPKSYSEISSKEYLSKYGYLINYNSSIPSSYIKYVKPSVLIWDKNQRLNWSNIKERLVKTKKSKNNYKKGSAYETDKLSYSVSDMGNGRKIGNELINISYIINSFEKDSGEFSYISQTLFDIHTSYYSKNRTNNKLIYLNIIFDIYEYYRQMAIAQINKKKNFEEVKIIFDKKYKEASIKVEQMKNETNYGLNNQNLMKWNNKIKSKLEIDNFTLIMNSK